MLGPDGGEGAEATGGLNVSDDADSDHLLGLVWGGVEGGLGDVQGGFR